VIIALAVLILGEGPDLARDGYRDPRVRACDIRRYRSDLAVRLGEAL